MRLLLKEKLRNNSIGFPEIFSFLSLPTPLPIPSSGLFLGSFLGAYRRKRSVKFSFLCYITFVFSKGKRLTSYFCTQRNKKASFTTGSGKSSLFLLFTAAGSSILLQRLAIFLFMERKFLGNIRIGTESKLLIFTES